MFEVTVTNNRASTKRGELLTEGQVGAKVHFSFNDHWTNMKKSAVFKRCGKTIVLTDTEWDGETAPVPPEMTEKAGQLVHVGVYGVSEDGKQITPTLYAPLGVVAKGAKPDGDPSTDPTLPVWAQIQKDLSDVAAKAVQADWNQNDPEQPDYVKHRLAYDSRSDEYDWGTITITVNQGADPDRDALVKYLGPIDKPPVSYTAELTGKNKYNEEYTHIYDSVYIGRYDNPDLPPELELYRSVAVVSGPNVATGFALLFVHVRSASEKMPAGMYMDTARLPWEDTEYGDMTLTVNLRFAESGELKLIDQKYLGPPAPFNWEYNLYERDAEEIRRKIGATDFDGMFRSLNQAPIFTWDSPTAAFENGVLVLDYTYEDPLYRWRPLLTGDIISFSVPYGSYPSSALRVTLRMKNSNGTVVRSYGPEPCYRDCGGRPGLGTHIEPILQSNLSRSLRMAFMWTGTAWLDILYSFTAGGTEFIDPVAPIKGGLPTGGQQGQVLRKSRSVEYVCEWANILPQNPKTGQVLVAKDPVFNPDADSLVWVDFSGSETITAAGNNADGWTFTGAVAGEITIGGLPAYNIAGSILFIDGYGRFYPEGRATDEGEVTWVSVIHAYSKHENDGTVTYSNSCYIMKTNARQNSAKLSEVSWAGTANEEL